MRRLMSVLTIALSLVASIGAADAAKLTKAHFCTNWSKVCNRTCPNGAGNCKPECARRLAACLGDANGCFFFYRPASRCFSSTSDRQRVIDFERSRGRNYE